jgi:putative DNA-invertase from lambdoid prophage Rac
VRSGNTGANEERRVGQVNIIRAAVYARVSTGDQNCHMQLVELRQYCATRGWQVFGEYVDTISGTKSSRPDRDKLMKDVRSRRVDVVLVWKLDRWGRSLADTVITLQELAAAGVRFICTTQGIDTDNSNPIGRAMIGMLSVFAQFEKDMINERVNAGVKRYQAEHAAGRARSKSGKNLPIGRPKSIFRMDEAIRMRAEGLSWRKIAKELGVPEATVRSRCVENRAAKVENTKSKQVA